MRGSSPAVCGSTRKQLGWNHAPFVIPSDIYAEWDAKEAGQAKESAWDEKFAAYAQAHPELAAEFKRRVSNQLPANWQEESQKFVEQLQACNCSTNFCDSSCQLAGSWLLTRRLNSAASSGWACA